jgi:hypothetical protein
MAKRIFDPKKAFMNIVSQGESGERDTARENAPAAEGEEEAIAPPAAPADGPGAPQPENKPEAEKEAYVRRTFYVTRRQYRELKIRAATSDSREDKFVSAIVRMALDLYFKKTARAG